MSMPGGTRLTLWNTYVTEAHGLIPAHQTQLFFAPNLASYSALGFFVSVALLVYLLIGRYAKSLEASYEVKARAGFEMAERLATAIELRDHCTIGHNHRVGLYCQVIAEELGFSPRDAKLIYSAAALHDIGKVGIPDDILNKSGPLDEDERKRIERHVEIGAALLAKSEEPLLKMAREIILNHHECWDGSGYPAGLRGEEIPVSGRIAAVADMFDALLSSRPYKKAWSFDLAYNEVRRLSGIQFDPKVIEAFERAAPRLRRISAEDSAEQVPVPNLGSRTHVF